LIEYSFISAIESKVLDDIVVTTDSKLISELAKKNQIDVRKRPKNLSKVNSNINCVILDVLRYFYKIKNIYPDLIILMEPTSPLRSSQTIVDVVNFFKNKKYLSRSNNFNGANFSIEIFTNYCRCGQFF